MKKTFFIYFIILIIGVFIGYENPEIMPSIFFNMFQAPSRSVIKFLSNKSNILDDLTVILKMPKWLFIKNIF